MLLRNTPDEREVYICRSRCGMYFELSRLFSLTNRVVLEQVGPLLRDRDGRHYRRRNDAAQNK